MWNNKDSFKSFKHKDNKRFSDIDYILLLGAKVVEARENNERMDYSKYDPILCDFSEKIFESYKENDGSNKKELAEIVAKSFVLDK